MKKPLENLKKKAQISHVFTFLIIILVIGVLALLGYKAINMILKAQCEHQRISFEKSLLGFIDGYSDYGSVNEETLKPPCHVKQVCFIDADYYSPENPKPFPTTSDRVMQSHANDFVDNIFFKTKFTEPIGFSKKIVLNNDPIKCFNITDGEFKFLFKGLGRKTRIEPG